MTTKHHGKILEFVLRKNDYNISALAKLMNVNRRTLYNWFNQDQIRKEILFEVGRIIRHDFSIQLPELFSNNEFQYIYLPKKDRHIEMAEERWRNKYFILLQEYQKMAELNKKKL